MAMKRATSKVRPKRSVRKGRVSLEETADNREREAEKTAANHAATSTRAIGYRMVSGQGVEVKEVRFGTAIVSNPIPDAETIAHNIKAGHDALVRVAQVLTGRGVKLHHQADVPKYRVDRANPRILLRELNGQVDRGHLVNGTFVATD